MKIDVIIDSQDKVPFFVGSMLRGAIGFALKKTVCINPSYECEGCFATKECVYYKFYEEENVFHAFRLDIVLQAKKFDFSLYLFENAIDYLPYVLFAIKEAVEEQGFGKERKIQHIRQIAVSNQIVYDGKDFQPLGSIVPNGLEIDSYCPNVEIEFTMPLRIKENNKFAKKSIALHTLVNNVHSRYIQIKCETPSRLNYRVEGEIVSSNLKFVDMQRYSSRQNKGMGMGGLKGTMIIKGLDIKSYGYLKIGEIIGAGKQTVFGLGSYNMKEQE